MLDVVVNLEIVESRLDLLLDVVGFVLERLCRTTFLVALLDALHSDPRSSLLHEVLSVPEEPLEVCGFVSVQHVLLSIGELRVRNQVKVPLGSLLAIVVYVSGSACIELVEVFSDVSLQEQSRVQLLALILQMVMANKLLLLENNKFGSFVIDFLLLAESKLELLVLQNLDCSSSWFPIKSLFENIGLQMSELLEPQFGAFHHEVARLLQSD